MWWWKHSLFDVVQLYVRPPAPKGLGWSRRCLWSGPSFPPPGKPLRLNPLKWIAWTVHDHDSSKGPIPVVSTHSTDVHAYV